MPQNEHIELARKRHGYRFDHFEKKRKKESRLAHIRSKKAGVLRGIKFVNFTIKLQKNIFIILINIFE